MRVYFYKYTLFGIFLIFALHLALAGISPSNDFDFGRVIEGKKVEHTFRIINKSREIKKISKVKSSCGCTAVVTAEREILPGGETTLSAALDTWGLSGKVVKEIEVFFEKEKDPLILSLTGEVKMKSIPENAPIIFVSQNPVYLGIMKKGEKKIFSLIIQNKGKENLYIKNFHIEREKDGLTLDKHPILPGKKIEASFSYHAARRGPIEDHLIIVSNDPVNPNLFIPLRGEVREIL
ncbi:MAG: DUF1573 domain-containing protein [Deltaproteobacteria bacterium]|nr:DUF1573 domain-containing protein [Deltaproteobacteria bacterium]